MYAQLYILGRSFAIGAAVLSLGACANVDQDAAFGGLKTTLGDRVTQDLAWRQDAASDVAVAAKVNDCRLIFEQDALQFFGSDCT